MFIAKIIGWIAELVFKTSVSLIDKILKHGMLQFDFYNPNYYLVKENNGFLSELMEDWFGFFSGSGQSGNPAASIMSVFYRDATVQSVIGAIAGTILALGIFFAIFSMVTGPLTDKKTSSPLKIVSKIIIWTLMVVLADQIMGVILSIFTGILNGTSISKLVAVFENIGTPENDFFQYPTDALLGDSIMLGLGTTMLMAIIGYIERYIALGFTCFMAKISFAFGVSDETEDVPKQFFMSIGQQLIGIVLTIFLMAMGAMALSTDYRGFGLDSNDSHLMAMVFCSIFMTLSANSEKFLNVLGFKTMANGSATRAVLGGTAAVAMMAQRAYGTVAQKAGGWALGKATSAIQASKDAKAATGAFHYKKDGSLGSYNALPPKQQKTQDMFNEALFNSNKIKENNGKIGKYNRDIKNAKRNADNFKNNMDLAQQNIDDIKKEMSGVNAKKEPFKYEKLENDLKQNQKDFNKNQNFLNDENKKIDDAKEAIEGLKKENIDYEKAKREAMPSQRNFADYSGHANPELFSNDKMDIGYAENTNGKQIPVGIISGFDKNGKYCSYLEPLDQAETLKADSTVYNANGDNMGKVSSETFEFDAKRGAAGNGGSPEASRERCGISLSALYYRPWQV